jgi:hypothetical protein
LGLFTPSFDGEEDSNKAITSADESHILRPYVVQRVSAFVLAIVFGAVPVIAQICDAKCAQHAGDDLTHQGLASHHQHTSDHHSSSDHYNDSDHRNDSDDQDGSDRHDGSHHYDRSDHAERSGHHGGSEYHERSDDHRSSEHQHPDRTHSADHHHPSQHQQISRPLAGVTNYQSRNGSEVFTDLSRGCAQAPAITGESRENLRKAVAGCVIATGSAPRTLMSVLSSSDACAVAVPSVLARSISPLRI